MKKMNKKGFTLIEMLAVIAIIAVLVAIIVPAVGSSTTKAKASTDAANLRSVLSAATIEYAETGSLAALDVDAPACKSVAAATSIAIYKNGDELVAYYANGTSAYYGVNDFAVVADGTDTDGVDTATPAGTLMATITGATVTIPTA